MDSIVKTIKSAAGFDTHNGTDADVTKTEAFYTTLATYPFLHLAANARARLPVLYTMCSTLDLSRTLSKTVTDKAPASANSEMDVTTNDDLCARVREALNGSDVGTNLGSLADYPEGRALVNLEKYHNQVLLPDTTTTLLNKFRGHVIHILSDHDPTYALPHHDERNRLERLACGALQQPPPAASQTQTDTSVSAAAEPTVGLNGHAGGDPSAHPSRGLKDTAWEWYVWGCRHLLPVLNKYLGPMPPTIPVDKVVDYVLYYTTEPDAGSVHGTGGEMLVDMPPDPVARLEAAVRPHVQHVTREQLRRFTLTRKRTMLEIANFGLGVVRWWLGLVARFFFFLAMGLRILGNGLSALGGLVAFTVVLSIAISVLSALTFLAASAADATGTFMVYMARFTDLAKRRGDMGASGQAQDKVGPMIMGPATGDELEDFIGRQLALRCGFGSLRTRPDVPRLSHSKLLVRCYDLGLVDNSGAILPHVSVEEVMDQFDPEGFFGMAPARTRQAGALILLRQLALRHVKTIMTSPTYAGEKERALRYVFLAGLPRAGVGALCRALTGLPDEYSKGDSDKLYREMRPILGHHASFLIVSHTHHSTDTDTDAAAGGRSPLISNSNSSSNLKTQMPSWVANPSHGVVSCLVFLVTLETSLKDAGLPGMVGVRATSAAAAVTPLLETDVQSPRAAAASSLTSSTEVLSDVWQALALHRPVLLAVTKCAMYKERLQADFGAAEKAKAYWSSALREEAHRRGLESDLVTILLVELEGTPPLGAVGLPQVQDWLNQVLADAPTLRCQ